LLDRRAVLDDLRHQPLFLAILGVAVLGALMPLALATAGVLAASWLQMRRRLAGFGLLRALGLTPRQLTRLLLGEQVVIYLAATALGVALGLFLAGTLAPQLIFSLVPFSTAAESAAVTSFFGLQTNPPPRLIIPPAGFWLLGGSLALNLLALGAMTRALTRDRVSQTLRFDEDA
jgi:ABC-type antimicrobial peptide transport system permease subunit